MKIIERGIRSEARWQMNEFTGFQGRPKFVDGGFGPGELEQQKSGIAEVVRAADESLRRHKVDNFIGHFPGATGATFLRILDEKAVIMIVDLAQQNKPNKEGFYISVAQKIGLKTQETILILPNNGKLIDEFLAWKLSEYTPRVLQGLAYCVRIAEPISEEEYDKFFQKRNLLNLLKR